MLLLLTLSAISARLLIIQPNSLKQLIPSIQYVPTNNYNIAENNEIKGFIRYSKQFSDCKGIAEQEQQYFLISESKCDPNIQLHNAHLSKASLLIFVSDIPIKLTTTIDGISAITISTTDATPLMSYLIDQSSRSLQEQSPSVFANLRSEELKLTKSTTSNNIQLGIAFQNAQTYTFLGDLKQYYDQFINSGASFSLQYQVLPCYTCEQQHEFKHPEINCYGGGRYCQYSEKHYDKVNGRELLDEIIRQTCIWQKQPDQWWAYITEFGKVCYDSPHIDQCSINIRQKLNIPHTPLITCYDNSFIADTNLKRELQLNTILDMYAQSDYNVTYPLVQVNNNTFKHNNIQLAVNSICKNFIEPPSACKITEGLGVIPQPNTLELVFLAFFIIIIVLMVVLLINQIYQKLPSKQQEFKYAHTEMTEVPQDYDTQVDNL